METLVIDRSRWACGGKGGDSALRNCLGNMCCLGFLAEQAGYKPEELADELTPYDILDEKSSGTWPEGVLNVLEGGICDSPWTRVAMCINDNKHITGMEREMMLTDHFESINIKVSFVGEASCLKEEDSIDEAE